MQTELNNPPELVLLMDHLDDSPVTARHILVWTRRDPVLSKVLHFVEDGWPTHVKSLYVAYCKEERGFSASRLRVVGIESSDSTARTNRCAARAP